MRVLLLPISSDYANNLLDIFRAKGDDVWCADSKPTTEPLKNFIKINSTNFEALTLAFRIANPDEIHYVCEDSLLRAMHVILASSRSKKLFIYFEKDNAIVDNLAKSISSELGFNYERVYVGTN